MTIPKTVYVAGSCDTKGDELRYVTDLLRAQVQPDRERLPARVDEHDGERVARRR